MTITESQVLATLSHITDPNTQRDLVTGKCVRNVKIQNGEVTFEVVLPYPAASQITALRQQAEQAVAAQPGVTQVRAQVYSKIVSHSVQRGLKLVPGVRNIIAVASGKGGVGKSTTAANLALALAAEGARVGVLDADIYGPSQPLLFGLQGQHPESPDNKSIVPLQAHGVQVMSIGFLIEDDDRPVVWRGPMATQALQQLLRDTRWDDLDYLIIDLPPGTGDIQLTLSQQVPVTGAIIVTTPQDIALLDARKGLKMFEKVGVPVIGIIENMSLHICSNCGHSEAIFGEGGGARMAEQYQVELLGQLPLTMQIREQADAGKPSVAVDATGPIGQIYTAIARRAAVKIADLSEDHRAKFPSIVIQNT